MKSNKKELETTPERTDTQKAELYKVVCGNFTSRDTTIKNAAKILQAGIKVMVTPKGTGYTLLLCDNLSETEAAELKRKAEEKGVMAEVVRQ